MWFFKRKHAAEIKEASTDAKIQSVRDETTARAKRAADSTDKLIQLLENDKIGVTETIFLATGGDKRMSKRGKR